MEVDVIVVGAGAAGIIAAWRSASCGASTALVEKTPRIGTKILISGGGKCNITHDGPIQDVLRAYRPNEAKFLRPACYRFTNRQIVEMLTSRGLEVYTRPNGRIFPVNQTAKDVVAILGQYLSDAGVELVLNSPVERLVIEEGRAAGVKVAAGKELRAASIVVAAGGSSYPGAGTTGDGWPWAREAGHTVVPVRSALAPIHMAWDEAAAWRSGIALRDVLLKARQQGREIGRFRDDVLFTHRGISGPAALGVSREIAERAGGGAITLEVDLRPDSTFEELTLLVRDWALSNPRRTWNSFVEEMLPERLVASFLSDVGVTSRAGETDRKAKNRIVSGLKGWELGRVRDVPIEKGEVVAGGISLDEVDSQTMRSRIVDGLYLCGEVLDIAGPLGGYNLQAAFSTGFVAGESAARASGG